MAVHAGIADGYRHLFASFPVFTIWERAKTLWFSSGQTNVCMEGRNLLHYAMSTESWN
jgi:hypothetical protein